jgi:hypothetical protein
LEREDEHVEHESNVLFEVLVVLRHLQPAGQAWRRLFRQLDAFFDLADSGEVFVELALILAAQAGLEARGIFGAEVEDALFKHRPALARPSSLRTTRAVRGDEALRSNR